MTLKLDDFEPVAFVTECEEFNAAGERPILREIDYYNDVVDQIPAGTNLYTASQMQQLIDQINAKDAEIASIKNNATLGFNQVVADMRHELDALQAQNAELLADAERYRWLRNDAKSVDWSQWIKPTMSYYCNCRTDPRKMDGAIDAEIAKAKGGE